MICRRWTTTTCVAAGRPATGSSTKRRPSWRAIRCRCWRFACSPRTRGSARMPPQGSGSLNCWPQPVAPAVWPGARRWTSRQRASHRHSREIEQTHALKTGALIRASVLMAALCATGLTTDQFAALGRFGEYVGLAFQVQDDILDVEGDVTVIGKPPGSDEARGMPTYPAIAGLPAAQGAGARTTSGRDGSIAGPWLGDRPPGSTVRLAPYPQPVAKRAFGP